MAEQSPPPDRPASVLVSFAFDSLALPPPASTNMNIIRPINANIASIIIASTIVL